MNIKQRLIKLEGNNAAQASPLTYRTPEEHEQWLESIEDKLAIARRKPIERWIVSPIPNDSSPSMAFLHNIMNRMAGGR